MKQELGEGRRRRKDFMSDTLFISRPLCEGTFQTALVVNSRRPDSESHLIAFIKALRRFALLFHATVK